MSMDGQGTKRRRIIAENFNRLSGAHERYRRHNKPTIAYSERERELTFAKKPHESQNLQQRMKRQNDDRSSSTGSRSESSRSRKKQCRSTTFDGQLLCNYCVL